MEAQEYDILLFYFTYAVGADLSFLIEVEDRGAVFKDNGIAKPGLEIFKDHCYNPRLNKYKEPKELLTYTETLDEKELLLESTPETLINISSIHMKGVIRGGLPVTGPLKSHSFFDDDANALPMIQVSDKYKRN
ncbi:MAG: hypothetical protein BalsKO_06810 [Balneolaceae bacterium]